jgi:hypothetical protein
MCLIHNILTSLNLNVFVNIHKAVEFLFYHYIQSLQILTISIRDCGSRTWWVRLHAVYGVVQPTYPKLQ